MINRDKFKSLMMLMGEYYGKTISEPILKLYWHKLTHMSDKQFADAVESHTDNSKFFPKLPELTIHAPKVEVLAIGSDEGLYVGKSGRLAWCKNTQRLIYKYPVSRSVSNKQLTNQVEK